MPVWKVEVPELGYLKKYGPLAYLLTRRNRLEDMAENRRVFYVGCTRAKNHLLLIGSPKKGMKGDRKRSLTPEDYRERASIMDLLDDIYEFDRTFPPEKSRIYKSEKGLPSVLWCEPGPEEEKGIYYSKIKLDRGDFGSRDQGIEKYDLTGPIRAPAYLQLSFKSIRVFRECPVKFFYNVVLGYKPERQGIWDLPTENLFNEGQGEREDDEMGGSRDALFLGSLIHGYLERHHFGDPLDESLFEKIWERSGHSYNLEKGMEVKPSISLKKRAIDQLKKTVYDSRLIELLKGEARLAEVPFLFTVSRGIEFRGVIDRLFREKDSGLWAIIDWKSNDLTERNPEDVAEENDYNLQLACYKWAVERILNEKVGRLYIYFTDRGALMESRWKGDPEQVIKEMIGRIREYERDMYQWINDLDKIRKRNGECRFCEYRWNLCR